MLIENNNPNLIPYVLLIIAIGIMAYNLASIIYNEIRISKLKHLRGLIIENHKKFNKRRNL